MNLQAYLEERRSRVDAFLQSYFEKSSNPHFSRLFESMSYSLLAGGKRVRPILTIAAYEACLKQTSEEKEKSVLGVAAALEFIHTYSLIHDDLPAMDNDDLRRGRPTNHKVFGESMAILAGDSLLTEAFLLMARLKGVAPDVLLDVIGDIAKASGAEGMAGGQVMDLESEKKKISREDLEGLHRHKTGCLILVSVTAGAKLAGARAEALESIEIYGKNIGLAFQIADDILDVEGGSEEMGKSTGGDAMKEKSTYPSLLGLEESKKLAQESADRAVQSLKSFDSRADPLRELALYIVSRKS